MRTIIDLGIVIGDDIRTRSRIRQLTDIITPDESYILDFSNVSFISRSFADELVSFIDSAKDRIVCVNMPDHISQLMAIVRRNRNTQSSAPGRGNVIKLKTTEQMEAFFGSF